MNTRDQNSMLGELEFWRRKQAWERRDCTQCVGYTVIAPHLYTFTVVCCSSVPVVRQRGIGRMGPLMLRNSVQ